MRLEIWSDIVCPWCFVGKRRLEAALAEHDRRGRAPAPPRPSLEVVWRSFELDPEAERGASVPVLEHLAAKYGGRERARALIDRVTAVAAGEGLDFRLEAARRGSSFDAHRLAHWARTHGRQDAFLERCMLAYFSEGAPIDDPSTLLRLVGDAGLDVGAARAILESDAYARDVRHDQAEARRLGITGVPCFVLARRFAVSGAQPVEVLLALLERGSAAVDPAPTA